MQICNPSNKLLSLYHRVPENDKYIFLSDEIINELDILNIIYSENYLKFFLFKRDDEETESNINKAQKYLYDNFCLKNIRILKDDKITSLDQVDESSFLNMSKDYFRYYSSTQKISPLNLNVESKSANNKAFGCAYAKFPVIGWECSTIVLPPYFEKIYINPEYSQIADTSYIHEIAHTQMENKSSTYENILHRELISSLLELIYANDCCCNNKLKSEELLTIKGILNNYKKINNSLEDNIYFYSKLLALKLFAIYYKSNIVEKIEMKGFIQKIFEGYLTVDNMLEHYNVSILKHSTPSLIRCLSI